MSRYILVLLALMLGPRNALATEYEGCVSPDYDWRMHTPQQLREIARSCEWEELSDLNYHRAYHAELVAENSILASLHNYADKSTASVLHAYRVYVALIEEIAAVRYTNLRERIRFLNEEYQFSSELAELRLRGYDALADNLERAIR